MKDILLSINLTQKLLLGGLILLPSSVFLLFILYLIYSDYAYTYLIINLTKTTSNFLFFFIGIFFSLISYLNYKKTKDIQYIFLYFVVMCYVISPLHMVNFHFLDYHYFDLFFFLYYRVFYFIHIFYLINLFFLSLLIYGFKINFSNLYIYIVLLLALLLASLLPISESIEFLVLDSKLDNKIYKDLLGYMFFFWVLILLNFYFSYLKNNNTDYLWLFFSMFLLFISQFLYYSFGFYILPTFFVSYSLYLYSTLSVKMFFTWI